MFRRCSRLFQSSGPFDPYKILGVSPTSTPVDIKRAYHKLALKYHPDSGGDTKKFQAIHEAYNAVKDGRVPAGEPAGEAAPHSDLWRPKYSSYSYEPPGSTTENYLKDGRYQSLARLLLVWCFAFVILRMLMYSKFPGKRIHIESEEKLRPE